MNASGKQIKRWRDKDNREVEDAAGWLFFSGCLNARNTHNTKHERTKTCNKTTHACMQAPNPPQVHSWLRQSDRRATENTHTYNRQRITPGQTELSYLSFIALVFFPRFAPLPPSAVKANAASARWVSSSRASSFHGPGKRTERGNKPLGCCLEWKYHTSRKINI